MNQLVTYKKLDDCDHIVLTGGTYKNHTLESVLLDYNDIDYLDEIAKQDDVLKMAVLKLFESHNQMRRIQE